LGGGTVAYANVPNVWSTGDVLTAADLNENLAAIDNRVVQVFAWTTTTAQATGVETVPLEGEQTITFSTAGTYRVVLNANTIRDSNATSEAFWRLGGTAQRLDPFDIEGFFGGDPGLIRLPEPVA